MNKKQYLGWTPKWDCASEGKLWNYNLHYFEWIWNLKYVDAKQAVKDWIHRYPHKEKYHVALDPYPTSLRLINWYGMFFYKHHKSISNDLIFQRELTHNMCSQAQHLSKNIEKHLLGNHLLENATALALMGYTFSGPKSKKWFDTALAILTDEIKAQILEDGCHVERSPMYHARATYLLLVLHSINNTSIHKLTCKPLEKMLKVTDIFSHPDGEISLLNDSSFNVSNLSRELINFADKHINCFTVETPINGTFALHSAGYYGVSTGSGSYLICDAGPIGPNYNPGHAHGDTFSFELSLNGSRVIVDSGVYDYTDSYMRKYCRSTRAHNTVTINNQDQCEFWGTFRVGRRIKPFSTHWSKNATNFILKSKYSKRHQYLTKKVTHARTFEWKNNEHLLITDQLTSSNPAKYIARFHLHPKCKILDMKPQNIHIGYPGGKFLITSSSNTKIGQEKSWYCPEFGEKIVNETVTFSSEGPCSNVSFTIRDF